MATPVITYERGTRYVTNVAGGATCYGLVGKMVCAGTTFATFERFSMRAKDPTQDFPHLDAGDYATAVMYQHGRLGRIINPYNGYGPSKRLNNVLVHAGTRPSHFEGCIGPGFLKTSGQSSVLDSGAEAMNFIWLQCGGKAGDTTGWSASALKIVFRVSNAFPEKAGLTAYSG